MAKRRRRQVFPGRWDDVSRKDPVRKKVVRDLAGMAGNAHHRAEGMAERYDHAMTNNPVFGFNRKKRAHALRLIRSNLMRAFVRINAAHELESGIFFEELWNKLEKLRRWLVAAEEVLDNG